MKYFIEYNLGWHGPPNKKAEKGTIVHKVLEILAELKLNQQNGVCSFEDDVVGEIDIFDYDLDDIIQKSYQHYRNGSPNTWTAADFRECRNWTYKALEYSGGEFDPRNANIIKAEQHFDIEIHKPWAMYDYILPDNTSISGFLGIKGTIDQVSQIDDDTYQILDWKTGRRLNWATGAEKDYIALTKDHQLMMYYYAAQFLYPQIEHFQVVIYFINDGGPYTICFSKDDIPRIEEMLQKKFDEIKNTEMPPLKKSWKCNKFCHFGMTDFTKTSITPIIEMRDGQVTPKGRPMTKCEQTKYCLEHRSIDSVIKHMSAPGHTVDFYKKPGALE